MRLLSPRLTDPIVSTHPHRARPTAPPSPRPSTTSISVHAVRDGELYPCGGGAHHRWLLLLTPPPDPTWGE
jgi:hypothetical protein